MMKNTERHEAVCKEILEFAKRHAIDEQRAYPYAFGFVSAFLTEEQLERILTVMEWVDKQ